MSCMCTEIDFSSFDKIASEELRCPIFVADIVNASRCISIETVIDEAFLDITLDKNEKLSVFKNMAGVYHLWVEDDYCGDHLDQHRMLCAYVGKGHVVDRVREHIKSKWRTNEKLYVSFYECDNRIAKYLEQLFLDCYKFYHNKVENSGIDSLLTMWPASRLLYGSEMEHELSLLSKKNPSIFNPEGY